jgi:hypothetical protein
MAACSPEGGGLLDPPTLPPQTVPFAIEPNPLRFPTLLLECGGAEESVAVRNRSSERLQVTAVRLDDPSRAFSIDLPGNLPDEPRLLEPREQLVIPVRFDPTELGDYTASLTLEIRGTADRVAEVTIEGRATDRVEVTDLFEQTTTLETDVVFVVDDSSSMSDEQRQLRENFRAFVRSADAGFTNYRVAVTTTDVTEVKGRFMPISTSPDVNMDGVVDADDVFAERLLARDRWVDRNSQPTPEVKFRNLARVGVSGDETEQGLFAAVLSVSAFNRDNPNFGFFRDDALWSVIIISDEPDQSPGSVQAYVDELKAAKLDGNVRASAVVGPIPDGCEQDSGRVQPAPRYAEFVRKLGGTIASICSDDWAATLNEVSGIALGLETFFPLSAFTRGPLVVRVDGAEQPEVLDEGVRLWRFERGGVQFEPAATPTLGADIEVSYSLACPAD